MTPPTEDPAITALNAVLKPLGTNLRHYEAYARDPAIAAMRAALEAERERNDALVKSMVNSGCALFLDGRNEHGSHVIPMFPNSMPEDAFGEDDGIPSMAEQIISAAEAAGFAVGHCVWVQFRWNADQTGEYGRVEAAGYWEFASINADLTRLLWGDQEPTTPPSGD